MATVKLEPGADDIEIKEEPVTESQAEDQSVDAPTNIKLENNNDQQYVESEQSAVVAYSNNNNDNKDSEETITDHDQNNTSTTSDDSDKTNLIVNYLPQEMSDEDFEDLFKKFGEMKSCKIVRNRQTGYSYGFGFVDFETHEQAIRAIDELNGHELEKKKIKVAFARPAGQDIKQANLYIKNIPPNWADEDVKKTFEPYGEIIQVRVLGNDRGIAFVLYNLRKQAEDALKALNGTKIEGCDHPLDIKFAADKKTDKPATKGQGTNNNTTANSNNSTDNNNSNNYELKNVRNSNGGGNGQPRHRERGHRGGRNRNRDAKFKSNAQNNQPSFFDTQRERNDRRNNHSNNNNNNYNNVGGPMRQQSNRSNRFTPFIPVQQPTMAPNPAVSIPPMGLSAMGYPQQANPAYGYPAQQPLMQYMLPSQQMMASMSFQANAHQAQINQAAAPTLQMTAQAQPMSAYQCPPLQMGYTAPHIAQSMTNMYSMASNTMNNAANMILGQPMRSAGGGASSGSSTSDGCTLFVYNLGPDSDEQDLRSIFAAYGHVVKCNVVRKTPGGETKGFGFVTMQSREQANTAIAGENGSTRNGRTLQVSMKK